MGLVGIARGNAIPFHDVRFVVSGLVVEECTASRFTTVAAAVHPPLFVRLWVSPGVFLPLCTLRLHNGVINDHGIFI